MSIPKKEEPFCEDREKLRSELERRLAEMKPRLKPTDRVRWLWGYYDALLDMKKQIAKGGKK